MENSNEYLKETEKWSKELAEWIGDNCDADFIPTSAQDKLKKLAALSTASFPGPDLMLQMIMMVQFVNAIFNFGYETAKMEIPKEVRH